MHVLVPQAKGGGANYIGCMMVREVLFGRKHLGCSPSHRW